MNIVDFEFAGKQFKIPVWNMERQIQNENLIIPLIKDPLMNAGALVASGDIGEELLLAAIIEGLLEAMSGIDMLKMIKLLLEGVQIRSSSGTLVEATIGNLEKEGCDLALVHILCGKIVKENYQSLLKKDLVDSLKGLLGNSLKENPSSTSE